jgi:hypothetical protein
MLRQLKVVGDPKRRAGCPRNVAREQEMARRRQSLKTVKATRPQSANAKVCEGKAQDGLKPVENQHE